MYGSVSPFYSRLCKHIQSGGNNLFFIVSSAWFYIIADILKPLPMYWDPDDQWPIYFCQCDQQSPEINNWQLNETVLLDTTLEDSSLLSNNRELADGK